MNDPLLQTIRNRAMNYLARREHSYRELRDKLLRKGFELSLIDLVLAKLQENRSLSDQRFTDCFIQSRINKGQGPLRIKQELQSRGIDKNLVDSVLQNYDNHTWQTLANQVRHQHFGSQPPQDPQERAKQFRFLQYRGFTSEQIRIAINQESKAINQESKA